MAQSPNHSTITRYPDRSITQCSSGPVSPLAVRHSSNAGHVSPRSKSHVQLTWRRTAPQFAHTSSVSHRTKSRSTSRAHMFVSTPRRISKPDTRRRQSWCSHRRPRKLLAQLMRLPPPADRPLLPARGAATGLRSRCKRRSSCAAPTLGLFSSRPNGDCTKPAEFRQAPRLYLRWSPPRRRRHRARSTRSYWGRLSALLGRVLAPLADNAQ